MLVGRLRKGGLATGLVCAVAAVAVAGCGSSSSSSSASSNQVIRAAYLSTNTSGYQMKFNLQLSSASLPNPITATGTGAFNTHERSGSVALDMDLGSSPQITQVLGSSTLHIEEVLDRGTIYVKFPDALVSKIPTLNGKPWLKVDLAKAAASAGVPGISSLVNSPTSSDPSQFLQYLRAAGTISQDGTEVVNGIQTTRYKATISLDKVPNVVPPANRQAAQAAIQGIEKVTNLHQIPVVAWIDGHNLVRRIRVSFNENVPSGGTVDSTVTVDIVKYGPQAPPTIPPADQVSDISSLTGAAAGSSGSASSGSSGITSLGSSGG